MKIQIRNLRFRYQIIILFLAVFLILSIGSGVAFYSLAAKNVTDNFKRSSENSLSQITNTMETRFNIISDNAHSMLINNSFSTALEKFIENPSTENSVNAQGIISDYLKNFERVEDLISSSYLYTEEGIFENYIHFKRRDFDFKQSPFYRV